MAHMDPRKKDSYFTLRSEERVNSIWVDRKQLKCAIDEQLKLVATRTAQMNELGSTLIEVHIDGSSKCWHAFIVLTDDSFDPFDKALRVTLACFDPKIKASYGQLATSIVIVLFATGLNHTLVANNTLYSVRYDDKFNESTRLVFSDLVSH